MSMDTSYIAQQRILPQSADMERAVLGALLLEGQAMMHVGALLTEEDFYTEAHRVIYAAIRQLYQQHAPIDVMTVYEKISKGDAALPHGITAIEGVGGMLYLMQLTNDVTGAAHIQTHAQVVKEKAVLRAMIRLSQATMDLCYRARTS